MVSLNIASATEASSHFLLVDEPRLFLSFTRLGEGLHGFVGIVAFLF